MSTPSTIQTDVPLVNTPFVDPKTGIVNETWFLFLIQLWRRTGGGGGVPPSSLTIADVLALEETFPAIATPSQAVEPNAMTLGVTAQEAALLDMIFAPVGGSSGSGAGSIADQVFSSGTDFTPGTTTTLTLANSFANAAQIWVFFDAAFQGDDQYSLSGTVLTFTSAIPVGTTKVYVKGLR